MPGHDARTAGGSWKGAHLMSSSEEREKAFEDKFRRDQEREFKAQDRRNYLSGKWAAEKLSLTSGYADVYAKDVVNTEFRETGDQDVLNKVRLDLKSKGAGTSKHVLREKNGSLYGNSAKTNRE